MISKKHILLVLLFPFLFSNCSSDSGNGANTADTPLNFGTDVSKNFSGQVVDENNIALSNVAITVANKTATTDVNGIFIINGATVKQKFAFVTAKKTGYLDGSRSLIPTVGVNNVKITLLTANVVGTVNSGSTGSVSLPNGSKVTFDGNFKTETGQVYSGTVSVIVRHLDPSDANIQDKMPGMLLASNSNGEERMLETFGMMNVELRGSASQKLQISTTAAIEMPITTSQLASSPASIPLWHFDEIAGYWKEEGVATKQGTKYVGTVSHFSWWNCDAQFSMIRLTVNVVNSTGVPLSGVKVGLRRASSTYPVNGFTNSSGQVCGLVPANETLTMTVYDTCNNVIYTATVGPFSADTTIPNVVISNATVQSTLVQGNLLKCDGTNVSDGYVLLRYGNQNVLTTVTNASFSFAMLVCNATNTSFSLQGFDYQNLQTTNTINYTFTIPVTNVGNLTACSTISEFISYRIDSNPVKYIIANITASARSSSTSGTNTGLTISANNGTSPITNQGFYLFGNTIIPGIYTSAAFSIEAADIGGISVQTVNTVSYNLSAVGAIGQYIDITFNGTYTNSTGSHAISGVAHVIRDN